MTTLDDIDTPYPLKDILPLAYPNGGMTLSGLLAGRPNLKSADQHRADARLSEPDPPRCGMR